ncbi:MAG: hypothetical protein K0U98_18145 [Deltaproteobacteria bacterium]|nr:hypothetical protein [Deltaproteobacteria bacterium]
MRYETEIFKTALFQVETFRWIGVFLTALLVTSLPARGQALGPGSSIFANDFESGGTCGWTLVVGLQLPEVAFGETVQETIGNLGEVDFFGFCGDLGDEILFRMVDTMGDLSPQVRLLRPDGTELCSDSGASVAEAQCTLDLTGAYRVLAEDSSSNDTGPYSLVVQRMNAPGNAQAMPFGVTQETAVSQLGEIDTFVFSATSGDRILLRMVDTEEDISPQARLFRPNGTLLCEDENSSVADVLCTVDQGGMHTLLASDNNGRETGAYGLYIQRTNDPTAAEVIEIGETLSASIALPGEVDSFVFSGVVSNQVLVRMTDSSETITPALRVFRTDGTLLCEASAVSTAEVTCTLPATGTYSILTNDGNGRDVGPYTLRVQGVV